MLNHESLARPAAAARTRIFKPGTALRVALAIITVLYVGGPTALQWMSFAGQRAEVAAIRELAPPVSADPTAFDVVGHASKDTDAVFRPALARAAIMETPQSGFVPVVQTVAWRALQIGMAALIAYIITVRRSSDHVPRHARPGLRTRVFSPKV